MGRHRPTCITHGCAADPEHGVGRTPGEALSGRWLAHTHTRRGGYGDYSLQYSKTLDWGTWPNPGGGAERTAERNSPRTRTHGPDRQ